MWEQPQNIFQMDEEGHRQQRQEQADTYEALHAAYDDEPRRGRRWWQLWRRERQRTRVQTVASGTPPDPRRIAAFRRAIDGWKHTEGTAAERSAAFAALTARFADLPAAERRAVEATALGRQGEAE